MRGNRLMRTAFRALRSRLLNNRRDAIENVANPDPVAHGRHSPHSTC
jgi:hypothetical protein